MGKVKSKKAAEPQKTVVLADIPEKVVQAQEAEAGLEGSDEEMAPIEIKKVEMPAVDKKIPAPIKTAKKKKAKPLKVDEESDEEIAPIQISKAKAVKDPHADIDFTDEEKTVPVKSNKEKSKAKKNHQADIEFTDEEEVAAVKATKKNKAAKKSAGSEKDVFTKRTDLPKDDTSRELKEKKVLLAKNQSNSSTERPKENVIPASTAKPLGSFFSRGKEDANGSKSGLLSSFWKRSKPSTNTHSSQEEVGEVEFPKIPKAYAEKRNMELLYGKNDSIN